MADDPVSALPSVLARVLAFGSILVGGVAGGLIGYAFAGVGMWATTYMKSWQDFEFISLLLMPMVLFSGTFFPIDDMPKFDLAAD